MELQLKVKHDSQTYTAFTEVVDVKNFREAASNLALEIEEELNGCGLLTRILKMKNSLECSNLKPDSVLLSHESFKSLQKTLHHYHDYHHPSYLTMLFGLPVYTVNSLQQDFVIGVSDNA